MFVFARLLDNKKLHCRDMKLKILYRGQLFRLNFQRLISPAFPTFSSTFLEMQKFRRLRTLKLTGSFFSHRGVGQVFNALDSSLPGKITNNNKLKYPMGV